MSSRGSGRDWPRLASWFTVPKVTDLKLFHVVQEIATELHREEMMHALVRALSSALEVRSVSVLLHVEGATVGRLVAATDAPKLRDVDVELARWPEAMAAMSTGETLFLGDVRLVDALRPLPGEPITCLARRSPISKPRRRFPLRPMGRTMGTLVLRTRRGEAPLTARQVSFAELAPASHRPPARGG